MLVNNLLNYEEILELWLRDFIVTMDNGFLYPGNRSGIEPFGVKIIFDGYGYNEKTDQNDNLSILTFAIFVHKNSLDQEFPEHEVTPWALIHRPDEEVCIYANYFPKKNEVEIRYFEEYDSTNLNPDFVNKLIQDIYKKHYC